MIYERIKKLREKQGYTQTELAKMLGVTRSCVNAWEMGISVPSTQSLVQLAQIFDMSTDYLLGLDVAFAIRTDGLSDNDIQLVHSIVQRLKNGDVIFCDTGTTTQCFRLLSGLKPEDAVLWTLLLHYYCI